MSVARYKDIVDGFVLSGSQIYQTENYRAHCLAQMEILRRARAYRCREYVVPNSLQADIPAYSQVEQAISVQPGSYVWGLTWTFLPGEGRGSAPQYVYIQITDACTETPFFSDYVLAENLQATVASTTNQVVRNPVLLSQPRLIGEPGKIDVEIYNSFSKDITCQLLIQVAEPSISPQEMERFWERERLEGML